MAGVIFFEKKYRKSVLIMVAVTLFFSLKLSFSRSQDERIRSVVFMETAYLPRRKDPRNTRMNPSPRNRNLLP